ncbi:geranylgeranyl pyrophosphate synthase [Corynebacterium sp. HMSC055G02]|uniref:polyprenyl synthetase family protein n=1 Tax=Corynebacterium TaxID=1716 RepID=UPI0008A27DD3|nr:MULTISPECIES: polyprenyl synthetase family protein [Corynebacterium]KAA0882528.1 polyprenyl synthetase family protein [Corynebacterium amycolatum]MBC6829043.1 polyprenyl synthetase family protein [Corynebacterium sp. LK32]MBC6831414.1 polyprenyl synthetase family protein [Corynebacterium sp. LK29]MBS5167689.1 polyprenyl synthetase family protein [Corynebacterium sp.]MDK8728191.1 polyprenyl synthetase family protein [Corynebacterium amycolatum]
MRTGDYSGLSSGSAQGTGEHTATSSHFVDEALEATITEGMRKSEDLLITELGRGEDFLVERVSHLAHAGGKRFRPMFTMLAAQFGENPECDKVITAATVLELTHLATLYHDDVMDEADKRRGVPSANSRWDNTVAILAGDYLFAAASRLLAELGSESVAHFAETFGVLVTGQMRECLNDLDLPIEERIERYLKVIAEKTGVLIASAGYLGAYHAGASAEISNALRRYGELIGIVFQIVDDIIDISSNTDQSGKTPGTDLREGVFTLPVLYALQEDTPAADRLREILVGPVSDDALVDEALELLAQTNGVARAMEKVNELLDESDRVIADLPDCAAKEALRHVARYTVERVG